MKGACSTCEQVALINQKLLRCVEYYASLDNWFPDRDLFRDRIFRSDIENMGIYAIGGKRARQVLKEIEEGK